MSEAEVSAAQDRMSELTGVVNVASAALCAVVAELVACEGWGVPGVRSAEHFVAWRTGVSPRRARAVVTIAKRWGELPHCQALFEAGSIGEDDMALIARLVPAERDIEVANLAPFMTHRQLQKLCSFVPRPPEPKPYELDPTCRFGTDDDGRWRLSVNGEPDQTAVLDKALTIARDDLFRQQHPDAPDGALVTGVTWFDAAVHMAEAALCWLDPSTRRGGPVSERYQLLVHVDLRDLEAELTAQLEGGEPISPTLTRLLACDASLSTIVWDGTRLVGITPTERIPNRKLRRAIERRDRGCRFPGCTATRWVQIHHIRFSEHGGPTTPCNLCALCPFHHRLLHKGEFSITGDPEAFDGLTFTDRWGKPIVPPPPKPPRGRPPDRPPEHLGLPQPRFTNPTGENVDWRLDHWWAHDPTTVKYRPPYPD